MGQRNADKKWYICTARMDRFLHNLNDKLACHNFTHMSKSETCASCFAVCLFVKCIYYFCLLYQKLRSEMFWCFHQCHILQLLEMARTFTWQLSTQPTTNHLLIFKFVKVSIIVQFLINSCFIKTFDWNL